MASEGTESGVAYFRVHIPLDGRSHEDVCEGLADFSVEGMEELPDSLTVFFTSLPEASRAGLALGGNSPESMADQNWSEAWQSEWRPLCVGNHFFLCPSWMDVPTPEGRIPLKMVPGNVFGGGDHPTTQLCLELLEQLISPGCRVADIGAGTGILTRATHALGAFAVGCDIDRGSHAMVDFIGSAEALAGGRFDGVIANIHLGVLSELRDELLRLLRPGGWMLVSGFLPDQAADLRSLFGELVELRERDGWCAAVVFIGK